MDRIKAEVKRRGITRLCHFVKTNKLLHILQTEQGIKAANFVHQDVLKQNDSQRLDGKMDYINCSIQYPNSYYLDRIKDNDPIFKEWAILFIDPEVICWPTNLFCQVNAATGCGRYITEGYAAFESLFAEKVSIGHRTVRTPSMLKNATTDNQAEVLVYSNIPRKYIRGIAMVDKQIAREKRAAFKVMQVPEVDIYIAPELFDRALPQKIRRGNSPTEYKYVEE